MTSEIPFTSNSIDRYDQPLLGYSTPNGALLNRLLSPITEKSAEILSTSLTINKTCSDSPSNIVLTTDNSSNDELSRTLLQRFQQHTTNFHQIQNYLNTLNRNFKELSIILEQLRNEKNLINIIEPIETRLLQMRVKRDQIDHLLNHSSIKNLIQQISPFIVKSKLSLDYHEFLNSIQLSLNQKTTLIDHLKNEYRYTKYQLNDYSSKLKQRHELLIKLINQIEHFISQSNNAIHITMITEHNRHCIELTNLSNEYKQLENENYLLTLKAKENIQIFSRLIQKSHEI